MKNLYEILRKADIINPIVGTFNEIPADYKIKLHSKYQLPHPWVHSVKGCDRNCTKFRIYFNHYNMIPMECMECWKITFSPISLSEAFATINIQRELGIASKVIFNP